MNFHVVAFVEISYKKKSRIEVLFNVFNLQ